MVKREYGLFIAKNGGVLAGKFDSPLCFLAEHDTLCLTGTT